MAYIKVVFKYTHVILKIACTILILLLVNCNESPNSTQEQAKKGDVLLELIEQNLNGDFDKTEGYLNDLFELARKENDTLLLVKSHLNKGIVLTQKGNYQDAINHFELGLQLLKKNHHYELYNTILLRIGNAYVLYGNDKKALSYYSKVNESAFEKNHAILLFKSSVNIAKVKRNAGKYHEALKSYQQAYHKTKYLTIEKKNVARVLMGIGGTFLKVNQPDSTLVYSYKGLEISNAIKDSVGQSYFYNDIGIAHFLKKEYTLALRNLQYAKSYIKSINNNERLAESYFRIGQCYFELNQFELAIENLEQVIYLVDNSKKIHNSKFRPLELLDTYRLLSESYQALGATEKAYLAEKAVSSLNKILNEETNDVIEDIHNSELRIRDTIIHKIKTSNEKTLKQNRLLILGLILVLFLSGLIFLYYKNKIKHNKKMFDDLVKKKQAPILKQKVSIQDSKVKDILKHLERLEEQEFFKERTCNLTTLAKKAKTNSTYLTKVLKDQKGTTFYQYINTLRINYAISRIKSDKQFRNYDIKHIAKEVGYKSPESFTKHFKKMVGIYPSYFIKELKKLQADN